VADAIAAELAGEGGGAWQKWERQVQRFHTELRRQLKATPAAVKGFTGDDGFLFYRNGFDYIAGGDLERQKRGKNPLPIIIEWKELLARQGVDFLFVPVPDKAEVYADKVAGKAGGDLVGKVVNPWGRKLLADLSRAGVETIDLLRPYLDDRKREPGAAEPLYQRQDTHWTPRGMALAADAIAARIKRYPWYAELKERKKYGLRAASFKRYGDLHARLPDAAKKAYQPEALTARQVVGPDGTLYVDDPDSPLVVLGDSFTGVLELTDCEHAGVSAHLARHLGVPVDLVMSYGGGPNVRHKLMRRGVEGLSSKRLVVWIMTARDLYNYWENWEPLAKK
jgi:alginate O-acetyltransferase complex protein AlgJ